LLVASSSGVYFPVAALIAKQYRSILDVVPNPDLSAASLALKHMNPGKQVGAGPDQLP